MLNRDPLILSIETATRAGSVSLTRGASVICSRSGDATASHSTDLIENIQAVIQEAKIALRDLEVLAVAIGPGSFTGIRIGLATIKGLATSLNRSCVGVSTLAAVAHSAGPSSHTIALLPAGRGEVYAQLFSVDERGLVDPADQPDHLSPSEVPVKYAHLRVLRLAGEVTQAHVETILSAVGTESEWTFAGSSNKLAESVAALALHEFVSGRTIPPDELRAVYVRPSDAEINERWLKQNPPSTAQP